jgi:hypothetical protein
MFSRTANKVRGYLRLTIAAAFVIGQFVLGDAPPVLFLAAAYTGAWGAWCLYEAYSGIEKEQRQVAALERSIAGLGGNEKAAATAEEV